MQMKFPHKMGSSQNAAPAIQNETAICTLPPLDAALTMRFAKNLQHDMSKVLRMPRKINMEVWHENGESSSEILAKV